MQLPRKIQAGSAARDAEDEAKARRSESLSLSGGSGRPSGQPLRLSSRGSSTPAQEAVSREEYLRGAELQVRGAGGQPFEKKVAAPVPETPAVAPPTPEPGFLGATFTKFLSFFGFK